MRRIVLMFIVLMFIGRRGQLSMMTVILFILNSTLQLSGMPLIKFRSSPVSFG